MRVILRYALLAVLASWAIVACPAFAGSDELTFSASASLPKEGNNAYQATGQYLIGLTPNFLLGPSAGVFDTGSVDGSQFGIAAKLRIGKKTGPWVGAACHVYGGDLKNAADEGCEARVGLDFGGERGFGFLYGSQLWTRASDRVITKPDGTSIVAGVGLRFGK